MDEIIEKFQKALEPIREAQSGVVGEIKELKNALDAHARRMDTIEVEMKSKGKEFAPAEPNTPDTKSVFNKYLRYGIGGNKGLTPDEVKIMSVADEETGGYWATPEIDTNIVRGITHYSPIRSVARVISINSKSYKFPTQTQHTTATWVGELDTRAAREDLKYAMSEIPTEECYTYVSVSKQNLEDSALAIESEISMDFSRAFGLLEGASFLTGTGIKQPQGILFGASGSSLPSIIGGNTSRCG